MERAEACVRSALGKRVTELEELCLRLTAALNHAIVRILSASNSINHDIPNGLIRRKVTIVIAGHKNKSHPFHSKLVAEHRAEG